MAVRIVQLDQEGISLQGCLPDLLFVWPMRFMLMLYRKLPLDKVGGS